MLRLQQHLQQQQQMQQQHTTEITESGSRKGLEEEGVHPPRGAAEWDDVGAWDGVPGAGVEWAAELAAVADDT